MMTESFPTEWSVVQHLDLRQTKCPLNFVKTRLALEKLSAGERLAVCIRTDGDSAINIPNSVQQEGHCIVAQRQTPEGSQWLLIEKASLLPGQASVEAAP
ncbi:MAG: sulfurtransferase TusA family protein [Candidatus Melainabacteria bacterium]|nr:sulfurtransferase TusA family protein [Candidatus Melainabacteria bacterium]